MCYLLGQPANMYSMLVHVHIRNTERSDATHFYIVCIYLYRIGLMSCLYLVIVSNKTVFLAGMVILTHALMYTQVSHGMETSNRLGRPRNSRLSPISPAWRFAPFPPRIYSILLPDRQHTSIYMLCVQYARAHAPTHTQIAHKHTHTHTMYPHPLFTHAFLSRAAFADGRACVYRFMR